jgi:pimeloyl-ACP methyl ester carboxylesterase
MTMTGEDGMTAVPGGRLAWRSSGTGPLAVWAHGLTQSGHSQEEGGIFDWTPVEASGRRLVRYDARGHGASPGEQDPGMYTWPALATDLLALLDALAPGTPVAGIGNSMGTATLLHAAILAPGRFSRLVLTAPPTAWEARDAQRSAYEATADALDREGQAAFERMIAGGPVPPPFADLADYPPAPRVGDGLLPSILRGAARSDLPDPKELAGIDLPVLVLAWSGDPVHPTSTAEHLTALLPDARLRTARVPGDTAGWGRMAAGFLAGREPSPDPGGPRR